MPVTKKVFFRYQCMVPGCNHAHDQDAGNGQAGHYWESTPPSWSTIHVIVPGDDGIVQTNLRDVLLCPHHSLPIRDLARTLHSWGLK